MTKDNSLRDLVKHILKNSHKMRSVLKILEKIASDAEFPESYKGEIDDCIKILGD